MISTSNGPSIEGAGPELLCVLLREFEAEMRLHGVAVGEVLAPGADRDRVRHRFRSAGLEVPDELVEWYAWHDGPSDPTNPYVLPGIRFEDVETTIRGRASLARSSLFGEEEWQWRPEWLKFTGDDHGVAMKMGEDSSAPPLVRSLGFELPNTDPDFTDTQVVSLCTPVTLWIEDVSDGSKVWDLDIRRWRLGPDTRPQWRRTLGY